jgi:hypothetical protein
LGINGNELVGAIEWMRVINIVKRTREIRIKMKTTAIFLLPALFFFSCDSKTKESDETKHEFSQKKIGNGSTSYQPPDSTRILPEKLIVNNTLNPFVTIVFGKANGIPEKMDGEWVVYELPTDNILLTKLKYRAGWKETDKTKAYLKGPNGELKEIKILNVRDGVANSDSCQITYRQFVLESKIQIDEEKIWESIMKRLGCEYYSAN